MYIFNVEDFSRDVKIYLVFLHAIFKHYDIVLYCLYYFIIIYLFYNNNTIYNVINYYINVKYCDITL